HHKELENILKYKDAQETLAVQKQLKIIEDNISNHYFGDWIADSFFKPKDILSGDSYSTLEIGDGKFLISVVDGMGKGVSASLSSVLTVSFINYAIFEALENKCFCFENLVQDTFNYASSIMLDDEALSFGMLELDLNKNVIKYVNVGLPPFYLLNDGEVVKLRPNNRPLLQTTTNYTIDVYKDGFDTLLVASDGLFESEDEEGKPYFIRFKKVFPQFHLLTDVIKDFKQHVEVPDDDTTIFYLKKIKDNYDIILDEKILLTKKSVEEYVDTVEEKLGDLPVKVVNHIVFALNELLMNAYEHSVLKLSQDKHNIIKSEEGLEELDYKGEDKYATLTISHSQTCAVLHLTDPGDGFDVSKVLKAEWFNKYHGRGVKMLKKLSDGIYYNEKGNSVKLYFKK
ncbi:MAG: SpoIIE family protein phosphatase, partial [Epsilonproteobacteria bacterium]|nr:SpoIIE family protein phosphatase [Campylobacterota bacterium]